MVLDSMKKFRKNLGFTLAEVLITLGIIGIVAAMVIPSLISNIRAHQYATKYKKALATLSNAGRMSLAQYGFDYSGINAKCNANSATDNPESKLSVCALLNGTLSSPMFYYGRENLKMSNGQAYKTSGAFSEMMSIQNNELPIYVLQDGTIIVFSRSIGMLPCSANNAFYAYFQDDSAQNSTGCFGLIDVNGTAPPNKEIKCSKGTNRIGRRPSDTPAFNCVVNSKDVTDVYPFVVHQGIAESLTDAGVYVFNNIR